MTDLRCGLVGLGEMGRNHARVLSVLPGVDLVGIAEPRQVAPSANNRAKFVRDIDELIGLGLDMAVVAVPTSAHEEVCVRLAEAGIHMLVEKPVASDAATALRLSAVVESAGVVACVGHIERYNPALRELRRRLAAGALGEIYQVATRRQGPFPSRIADVGVILDLATHDLDLTGWVTRQRYESLSARTAHRSGRHHEDLVAAVGILDGGTVANHLVNWLSPLKERVTVVTGERGAFVADTLTADLTYFANGVTPVKWDTLATFRGVVEGDVTRYAIAKKEPLVSELEAFRDAVLGSPNGVVTLGEAASAVAVAEACLRSSETGESAVP